MFLEEYIIISIINIHLLSNEILHVYFLGPKLLSKRQVIFKALTKDMYFSLNSVKKKK